MSHHLNASECQSSSHSLRSPKDSGLDIDSISMHASFQTESRVLHFNKFGLVKLWFILGPTFSNNPNFIRAVFS